MDCGYVCNLLISQKTDTICLFYNNKLDSNRVGSGCGFVRNISISQKRGAISCCIANQVRSRWRTGDGGRGVDKKGLDGGRDRTAGFLVLIQKVFLFKKKKIPYF